MRFSAFKFEVGRSKGLFFLGTLCLLLDDYLLRFNDSWNAFLYRFDNETLKLSLFSFIPMPNAVLYHLLLAVICLCLILVWRRKTQRWCSLILAMIFFYIAISNLLFAHNFHFFTAFSMLGAAILSEDNFKKFMKIQLCLVYICCVIYRATPLYFSGLTIDLEIMPKFNFSLLSQLISAFHLSAPIAIGVFIAELAIVIGLLTSNYYLGFVLPIILHLMIAFSIQILSANMLVIAVILGISPVEYVERFLNFLRRCWAFWSVKILLPAFAIVTWRFAIAPGKIFGTYLAFVILLLFVSKNLSFQMSDVRPVERLRLALLSLIIVIYASTPIWTRNMAFRWYSYAMYSGFFYDADRELYGLGNGLQYSPPGFVGVFAALEPSFFKEQRILRIARIHWFAEYMRYICKPYFAQHKESMFASLDLYLGPKEPNFRTAAPIMSISRPCMRSEAEWQDMAEKLMLAQKHRASI